ncbi:hypothetical protein, partial [Rhodococcus rhodochrous]|uniref:hypothetical protein n=1 Tax=Rhodococcus rhodochrous TaxID=1829 RepID=UPI0018E0CB78
YDITNDDYVLPNYEKFAPDYSEMDKELEKRIITLLGRKFPGRTVIRAEMYFRGLKHIRELRDNTSTTENQLVTRTPGYVRRTNNPNMGRPAIGSTRKVSLALSDELWQLIDERVANGEKMSAVLRELVEKG